MKTKVDYKHLYSTLHRERPKLLSGQSIVGEPDMQMLLGSIDNWPDPRILDYGSGKGHQYLINRIHEDWGVKVPHCYDIGISGLDSKPKGLFDGVLCNDVLEHIHESDLDAVLDDIFGYLYPDRRCFAFLGIDTKPARKKFRHTDTEYDGEQLHLTLHPAAWWDEKLTRFQRDNLTMQVIYHTY